MKLKRPLTGSGHLESAKHLCPKLPYDPIKGLAPVALTQRIAQDTAVYGDVIAKNKIRIG